MKISKVLKNPWRIFSVLSTKGVFNRLSDRWFIRLQYRSLIGKWPNLEAPTSFNEKLQWLKLHYRKPEHTVYVDKYAVRAYIAEKLGEEYLIPLLGVWDDPDEIDFDKLPDQFVLKCNHNSGSGMCICKDKSKLDIEAVKKQLRKGLAEDYYLSSREWPYKNVPRKIICEAYMSNNGEELADYKVHNFNGEPKMILVCRDRFAPTGLTEDFFDTQWKHLDMRRPDHPNASREIPRPEQLEQMIHLSRELAQGMPFVRTDFYVIEGKLYFGEITFFPSSGFAPFVPKEWDDIMGQWLHLPQA